MVEIYFVGRADQWMSSNNIDTTNMNWPQLCNLTCKRFAAEGRVEIVDTFKSLQQNCPVSACKDPGVKPPILCVF